MGVFRNATLVVGKQGKIMTLYKLVDLEEGELVNYVGVYVTRWQREWGQPAVGFVEVEPSVDMAVRWCEICDFAGLETDASTEDVLEKLFPNH